MVHLNDVRSQVTAYLGQGSKRKGKKGKNDNFIKSLRSALFEGRLDHNHIRKIILNISKAHDLNAVLLGSLLLQLDNDEIIALMKDYL
jgi:hypothetical protein